jgi:hypothetical protein
MGQRSQQFIKVMNPLPLLKKEWGIKKFNQLPELAKWKKIFGMKKYSILTYHHQWLYGVTFPALMYRVLDFYKNGDTHDNHPLNLSWFLRDLDAWDVPKEHAEFLDRYILFHTYLMGINTGQQWLGARIGALEGFRFTNLEDPKMIEQFDMGDNNDGICIVDPIEGKYAFISINGCEGQCELPKYVPLSAEQYAAAYYPSPEMKRKEGYKPLTKTEAKQNARRVAFVAKKYKDYAVMTKEEILKLFPKMADKMK